MVTPKKRCEIDLILNLLTQGFTKPQIRKKLNIKPSALANHLRRLENLGYIERQGKYLIKVLVSSHLTPRVTKNQVHINMNKRGHAHSVKVYFPNEPDLLNKTKVKNEFKAKLLTKLSFGSMKLIKNKCSIWINKGSLTIYSNNSYYSQNALHTKFRALKEIDALVRELKDRFGFRGYYGIEVFREHYGLIFNKFAQWILKQGKSLYVKEKGKKTILWVDNSRKDDVGLEEFEADDPIRANTADEYFNSHERTGWKVTPEKVLEMFNEAGDLIKQNAKNLNYYGENVVAHVKLMQSIDANLKKQTKLFEAINHSLENGIPKT